MSETRILDADMATVGRWLAEGFGWWRGELAGLIPERWRGRGGASAVQAAWDGHGFALTRRGQPFAAPKGPLRADVTVPAARVLTRALLLPALGAGDLRRLIGLEAERLMPFPAGTALLDSRIGGRDAATGKVAVEIAALPRPTAEAALAAADTAGIEPVRLGVPGFDFLPQLAGGVSAGARARRFWWGTVAALAVLNLLMLVIADVQRLRDLELRVAEHGIAATSARTLRARVIAEDQRRRGLLARRDAGDPLRPLAAATRALPAGSWAQRAAWDGTALRLTGLRGETTDVPALLRRAPEFASVRATSTDISAGTALAIPFDVTATVLR